MIEKQKATYYIRGSPFIPRSKDAWVFWRHGDKTESITGRNGDIGGCLSRKNVHTILRVMEIIYIKFILRTPCVFSMIRMVPMILHMHMCIT